MSIQETAPNGEWMMEAPQSLLELVAVAQAKAKTSEDRVVAVCALMDGGNGTDAQVKDLRAATVELELLAVDIFSVFEARMQHHFRRGPFSRKLRALLLESKKSELAGRVHQYYLAINVLKHGKGASYRALLDTPNPIVVMRPTKDIVIVEEDATSGLVDVTVPGFFEGLTATILEAYHFLENRQES